MITRDKIKQAAKEWAIKMSNAPDKDTPDWIECDFKGGAEWALEQCPYSREDMIDLLHFVRLSAPNWIIPDDELVKLWEEQK